MSTIQKRLILVSILLVIGLLNSCINNNNTIATEDNKIRKVTIATTSNEPEYKEQKEEIDYTNTITDISKTNIHFPDFKVVIQGYKGYEIDSYDGEILGLSKNNASLVSKDDGYEYVLAKQDTLFLYETMDERINENAIRILPNSNGDTFKVYGGYVGLVYELINTEGMEPEAINKAYEGSLRINEVTKYIALTDAGNFNFKSLPDNDFEIKVQKYILDKETNTIEYKNEHVISLTEEFKKVKQKYGMRDTLVEIPMEFTEFATLTKNGKLFNYMFDSHIFRIEQYRNNVKISTKYIVINIMYGC